MRPDPGEVLHFSEDPTITRFEPIDGRVWAVGYERAPDYWFPRMCPRGMAWAGPSTSDTSLLGPGVSRVHVIEYDWLPAMQETPVYAYRLPADTFEDIGHAMVSSVPVTPLGPPTHLGDLLKLHEEAGIELRLTHNIWPWWHQVIESGLDFSGIRLRNARTGPLREDEYIVHVRDGFVWAQDTGEPDLQPVVFVHAGMADSRIWDRVWRQLSGSYRLIRFDARGFGRSARPTTTFSLSEDLLGVLDELSLDRPLLVGLSMGGGAALDVALSHPSRVAGLVLAAPGISGYDLPWDHTPPADPVARGMSIWGRAGDDPLAVDLLRGGIEGWSRGGDKISDTGDAWQNLEALSVASTLLIGDLDYPPLVESNLEAARRMPGCRLVSLPGVDHFLPFRAPSAVVEAIRSLTP